MTAELPKTERKYQGEAGVVLPSFRDLPGVAKVSEAEPQNLVAEYFDTSDLRLLLAGVTLRRREGGPDEGWQLKLPGDEGGRGPEPAGRRDVRAPLAGGSSGPRDLPPAQSRTLSVVPAQGPAEAAGPVPAGLARLVRVHTRGGPLRPVARIETCRRRSTLRDRAGQSLAEVVIDEVSAQTLGESTTLSHWDEAAVELTGGSPQLLRAVRDRLRGGGLRPTERVTKLEHAFAMDTLATAGRGNDAGDGESRPAREPGPLSSAGAVVMAYLDAQSAQLKALDPAVRSDEPDAVHQMRVTARRLRAALRSFPMVLPQRQTQHVQDELRWLGQVLGGARDCEVLRERFRGELATIPVELVLGPVKARITTHFTRQEATAQEAVLGVLDSERYFALLGELDGLLAAAPKGPAAASPARDIIPFAVAKACRRTKLRMRRAWRQPPGPARDMALHDARKAAKRARYAAEVAEPAGGKAARRIARQMKAVQTALGEHQDAVTAREAARDLGIQAHLAGESAFTFGLLNERARQQALVCQRQARQTWKQAAKSKPRHWLP
jgi:CHAD domain-containing protein